MQDFNYHTHTYRCGHADDNCSDEDYVKSFIKNGFKKIAFTDHAPQKPKVDTRLYMRMEYSSTPEYLESINSLRLKYKDKIEIESGFEVEYLPNQVHAIMELKQMADKIILGQHFVYNEDKSALKIFKVDKFSDDELIRYANYIKEAMELRIPDVVAHPDIFMVSSNSFGEAEQKATRIICETSKRTGIPLEINLAPSLSRLSNPNAVMRYPNERFWKIASEYGVNVVYGIDAHSTWQIDNYKKSIEIVNEEIGTDVLKKLNFISY